MEAYVAKLYLIFKLLHCNLNEMKSMKMNLVLSPPEIKVVKVISKETLDRTQRSHVELLHIEKQKFGSNLKSGKSLLYQIVKVFSWLMANRTT